MNGFRVSFNPHVESLVFKKIGNKVALLFQGRIMATRPTVNKHNKKELQALADKILDKFIKRNSKAIERGKLLMNIKNEDKLDKWFA